MKGTLGLFYLRSVTKSKNGATPSNPYPSAPPVRTTTSSLNSTSKRSPTILRISRSFFSYRWAPEFFFFFGSDDMYSIFFLYARGSTVFTYLLKIYIDLASLPSSSLRVRVGSQDRPLVRFAQTRLKCSGGWWAVENMIPCPIPSSMVCMYISFYIPVYDHSLASHFRCQLVRSLRCRMTDHSDNDGICVPLAS